MTLSLFSSAFASGDPMPARYTGEGPDVSPPLSWHGAPAGTKTFALIVDDPDAPDPAAPRRTWVHWVAWNIPATVSSLPEAASGHAMPEGSCEGKNDSGDVGYGGPYPPIGRHRYFFKLYALDSTIGLGPGHTKAELLKAMEGRALASAELMGTYELTKRA
jgi:Raf kinase inhibitor-like YbhB/YbcL family protein